MDDGRWHIHHAAFEGAVMLFRYFSMVIISVSALTAGCAIHPLPSDVNSARKDTVPIVRHIRCETREAFKSAIHSYFEQYPAGSPTAKVGAELRTGQLKFEHLDRRLKEVDADAAFNVRQYQKVAVGYDFNFDMTEDNMYAAQVNFLQPINAGSNALGLKAGGEFLRQTVRIFRVEDTFAQLMALDSGECDEDKTVNFAYPVRGNIGLGEMVKTFVDLNEFEKLTGAKDAVPVLSDTFNFQTTLTGTVNPSIMLSPIGHLYRVADASIGGTASRKDYHKVIVAMSLPVDQKKPASASGIAGFVGGARVQPPTTAKERVNRALDDQINRSIVNQLSIQSR